MTRDVARRLSALLLHAGLASAGVVAVGASVPACYSGGGGGRNPPTTSFYFPVGLAVSYGGSALYAVNSDFDLQWNGGTLQSYDLFQIRRDTAELIRANTQSTSAPDIAFLIPWQAHCQDPSNTVAPDGTRIPLGEACAPPVDSQRYQRDSAVIGAFATDLQLQTANGVAGQRLFAPVRGDATLTWADVGADDKVPPDPSVFKLQCGQDANGGVCDAAHHAGNDPHEPGDTRLATMPGEPFGMAQTEDGTAIAITHQTETETSLLLAGAPEHPTASPSMQFVLTDVLNGGSGITAVPHDPDASVKPCENEMPPNTAPGAMHPNTAPTAAHTLPPGCVNPAFLETSHDVAELDLLRYYNDDGSSLHRPFLTKERIYNFNANFGGSDSRGIVIDATPRMACKDNLPSKTGPDLIACAELPARVFFANRTPPSLVVGAIGARAGDGTYDPDLLTFDQSIPLPAGPSRVYLAPIVNQRHQYELRVFVVNYDSSTISVYDPDPGRSNLALVDTIYVGPGPFAMAFDPFDVNAVAANATVPLDTRQDASLNLRKYRFAYIASFTQSYVQVIDLDQSQPTYERVVFTLGKPTPPKGT
jgi:hypothetical protein